MSRFLNEAFKTDVPLHTVARALETEKLRTKNEELQVLTGGDIIEFAGKSAAGQTRQIVARVAQTDSRVLISGPPGSGKSVLARLIHQNSLRSQSSLVVLSLRLAPENLDARLFWIEANENAPRNIGVLERAHRTRSG